MAVVKVQGCHRQTDIQGISMAVELFWSLLIVAMGVVYPLPPVSSVGGRELVVAVQEMERANYFTFVLLLNMVGAEAPSIPTNVTFFMPSDRALSRTILPEDAIPDFLLRHSIPSPLLFDYLAFIPTGSLLPTACPTLMLNVSNNGRDSFYLNNAKLTTPNICTAVDSIRCHGIDRVIEASASAQPPPPPSPPPVSCSNTEIESPLPQVTPVSQKSKALRSSSSRTIFLLTLLLLA